MNGTNLNRLLHLVALLGAIALIAQAQAQAGAILSEVDDFEVDREGWGIASSGVTVADGGPGGAGDGYLAYASNGTGGPGSRMVIPNESAGNQWEGDYLAEGVTAFQFDVLNDGGEPLNLRVAIANASTWYVSTVPTVIGPGSPWTSVAFQISEEAMTSVGGADSFDSVASDVRRVRILSSVGLPDAPLGGLRGDVIAASIGIDNFTAIPEPATAATLFAGLLAAASRRRV